MQRAQQSCPVNGALPGLIKLSCIHQSCLNEDACCADGTKKILTQLLMPMHSEVGCAWSSSGQTILVALLDVLQQPMRSRKHWMSIWVTDVSSQRSISAKRISLKKHITETSVLYRASMDFSATGEYIGLHMLSSEKQTLVISASGALITKVASSQNGKEGLRCEHAWHPELSKIAYASSRQIIVHDVQTGERGQVVCIDDMLASPPQEVLDAIVECWSPCGHLLCISLFHGYHHPGQKQQTIAVARADGSGIVFNIHAPVFVQLLLPSASTGLLSIIFEDEDAAHVSTDRLTFDLASGKIVVRDRRPRNKCRSLDNMQAHPALLFGGTLMAMTVFQPHKFEMRPASGIDRMLGRAELHTKQQVSDSLGKVCVFDMRSEQQVCQLDESKLLRFCGDGPLSVAATSPRGDRLFLTRSQQRYDSDPSKKPWSQARLLTFGKRL